MNLNLRIFDNPRRNKFYKRTEDTVEPEHFDFCDPSWIFITFFMNVHFIKKISLAIVSGGIEQPKIQSVIGLFRRESVGTSDTLGSHEIDESDEYTAMRFEQGSPSSNPGKTIRIYQKKM